MTRHVERLLAAYVDGQLAPQDASRVYQHLMTCRTCRVRLSAHEHMAAELKLALNTQITAQPADVSRWWKDITKPRVQPTHSTLFLIIAPALLAILIVGLPLMTTLPGRAMPPASANQFVDSTQTNPPLVARQPVAGLIPQPELQNQTTAVVATAAPQDIAATAAPVPLAPSMQ
jgi:anti-sigma factor RsiW